MKTIKDLKQAVNAQVKEIEASLLKQIKDEKIAVPHDCYGDEQSVSDYVQDVVFSENDLVEQFIEQYPNSDREELREIQHEAILVIDETIELFHNALFGNLEVTDIQVFAKVETQEYAELQYRDVFSHNINYAINDSFLIQYDSNTDKFSIPHSNEQSWNNDKDQDEAYNKLDAGVIANILKMPRTLENLYEEHGDSPDFESVCEKAAEMIKAIGFTLHSSKSAR